MAASHNYEIIIIPAKAKHSLFFFYNPNIHMMNVWFLLALLLLCTQLLLISNTNLALAADTPTFACDTAKNPGLANLTFCNRSLDMKTRVNDLIKRLTLEEKIGFLIDSSRGVSRLGIPNYEWWSEALHGVAKDGKATHFKSPVPGATSFPQPILTAASFNFSLFQTIGKVVSTEARAMYNVGQTGLTFWSPNVNIFRDPRWGRGQETPGEDPSLSATYAQYYVRGLQQRDDGAIDKLKVAACCKHYTAYDLENWKGNHRFTFNAVVTQQDLVDTFQVPFMSCVLQGKVASVMCSYNQVNGKPTCGDPKLLAGVIRGNWNLDGYIVSDCDSLDAMFTYQKYTKTPEETAALALNSGLNVNCQGFLQRYAQSAVDKRLVNISTIDVAIANNFRTLMRLGFFDGDPRRLFYGNLGPKDVCTPQNQELAREAARQGIVLLKNTVKSLPLSASAIKSLALIGPNANVTDTMLGNYAGIPCQYVTPLQGLEAHVSTVVYVPGCDNIFCKTAQVDDAQKIAAKADAVILVMGTNLSIEQEGVDRDDITLPGKQSHLVTSVAKVAKGPVILVLMSGGCLDVQFAKDNPKITSIFWVGFPGEKGGAALADLIFGLHSPSGKLPITWYPQSYVDKVNMTNMNMRPDLTKGYPGRTYRFYTGTPVFPFGFGLSYTLFHHSLVQAPDSVTLPLEDGHVCRSNACKSVDAVDRNCKNRAFDIHLRVKNKGKMSGSHTVLLFSSPPSVHNAPKKQLVAFEKLHLTPQEEGSVRFKVDVCKHLSVVDEAGKQKIALGKHVLHVGDVKHSFTVMI